MMVKVRTKRKHGNGYGPKWLKNPGRIYEATARDAANLVHIGAVELAEGGSDEEGSDADDSQD